MPRVVNGLEEARAALVAGAGALTSPPFAACHAGVNYYRHLLDQLKHEFPDNRFSFTLCCGDDAAIAHDALRMGFARIMCGCAEAQFAELQETAIRLGAHVLKSA